MANIRRVKVVVTGYYDVDMADADQDYGTSDPEEMLKIDASQVEPSIALDQLAAEDITMAFSWEN